MTPPTGPRPLPSPARRVVIKVGSSLIADSPAGRPAAIADEIAELRRQATEVVVVSSGAIALGARVLGRSSRPTRLPDLQAAAAVGQSHLLSHWDHAFGAHDLLCAQVLLTHDDLSDRPRFLNARHALRALLDAGVIPVVNENDTVAVDEIKYGDNDLLAALVCNLMSADTLLVLTDVDGLHTAPPDNGGTRIPQVLNVDLEAVPVAQKATSGMGSGGMASKVQAARSAALAGVATVVVSGRTDGCIGRALAGDDVGTLFVPSAERLTSRKHWIAYGSKPLGRISVDNGAHRALVDRKKSLLPAGITEVAGTFGIGDIVSLVTSAGTEFARGLAGYSADDLRRLVGVNTADIQAALGYKYLDEAVHRDDLVLL